MRISYQLLLCYGNHSRPGFPFFYNWGEIIFGAYHDLFLIPVCSGKTCSTISWGVGYFNINHSSAITVWPQSLPHFCTANINLKFSGAQSHSAYIWTDPNTMIPLIWRVALCAQRIPQYLKGIPWFTSVQSCRLPDIEPILLYKLHASCLFFSL